jgi:polar amino acid transport system substrate-binding protein
MNIKKFYFLFLLISLLPNSINAITFTEEEKAFITTNQTVKIALMPDFSPFSYIVDDRVVGFEHDLLFLLSQKTGLKFTKQFGVWNKNLYAFRTKQVDMITSISYKEERESFTLYTKPYYEIPIMIFVRDDFKDYNDLQSLTGKKVGVLKDVFYNKELEELKNINLIFYETYDEITQALVFGKIDALIQNLPNINYLIKKNLYTNLKLAGELKLPNINKEDLRFGVIPEKPLLKSIIQKGLDDIRKDEWETITDRWIDVKYNERDKKHISLTIDESKYLKQKKQISLCINPNGMPFEAFDKNGEYVGMSADYIKLFEDILSTKFEVIKTDSWTQSLEYGKERICDISSLIVPTPQRREYLNFTMPYLNVPLVISTKLDVPFINEIKDLTGYKIGIPSEYAFSKVLKEKYPFLNIIEVKDIDDGLEKVNQGKLFAFIGTLPTVSYKLQTKYPSELKIAGKILDNWEFGMGVRNDDIVLLNILQKAIKTINSDQQRKILNKWVSIKYEKGIDYSAAWKIFFLAVILLLIFTYWNRKISKANRLLNEAQKEIELKNEELQKLATTDKLTEVFNRAKLDEILQSEINRSERFNYTFGIAFLDIDFFKKINDTYGHQIGDKVLIGIADILKANTRITDSIGRWGGEEFLIICPESSETGIKELSENLRRYIQNHNFLEKEQITVSFGISIYESNDTIDSILKRADDALYDAKNSGRNKVVIKKS